MAERKAEKSSPAKPPAGLGLDEPPLSAIMAGVKDGVGGLMPLWGKNQPTHTKQRGTI